MTMTTDTPFTPGPWEIIVPSISRCFRVIVDAKTRRTVAEVIADGEEGLAYSRLFAKSRELLEALEERVLSDCSMCRGRKLDDPKLRDRCHNKVLCRVVRYQRLIAEAKGETIE